MNCAEEVLPSFSPSSVEYFISQSVAWQFICPMSFSLSSTIILSSGAFLCMGGGPTGRRVTKIDVPHKDCHESESLLRGSHKMSWCNLVMDSTIDKLVHFSIVCIIILIAAAWIPLVN